MGFEGSTNNQLSLENFRGFIAQIVKEELAKVFGFLRSTENEQYPIGDTALRHLPDKTESSPQKITRNWLTHSEAATYLKTTSAVLYKLSSLRKIKFSKRGKRNYYKIEHLEQYLTDGEVQTQEEIARQTKLKGKMKII